MNPVLPVSGGETTTPFCLNRLTEMARETRRTKTSGNPGVSAETASETKPQFVSASRAFFLLEKAERDDGARCRPMEAIHDRSDHPRNRPWGTWRHRRSQQNGELQKRLHSDGDLESLMQREGNYDGI